MTINRNNYESYFLLYIDNELCQADKIMVEAFVQQHTDLKLELVMLQHTVLCPAVVSFEQKNNLLKMEAAFQEKLLLHLDGELSNAEVAVLQNELQGDKSLQEEWELLQQTKLHPQDLVIFEHKERLLRKEPARVISAKWWRAAAAVLIGLSLVGTVLVLTNKNNKLAGGDTVKAITSGNGDALVKKNTVPINPAAHQTEAAPQAVTVLQQNPAVVKKEVAGANAKDANSAISEQKLVASAKEKDKSTKENSTIPERLENINNTKSNETGTLTVQLKERIAQPAATETVKNNTVTGLAKPLTESSLKINNASYAVNTKTDETEQSDYLMPDDKKFRRSGLVRKVSRFFQRSTKKKADGDGLKIAGFEFAVR
jgi:hypothetical protein